jgi:hypothetical protein
MIVLEANTAYNYLWICVASHSAALQQDTLEAF